MAKQTPTGSRADETRHGLTRTDTDPPTPGASAFAGAATADKSARRAGTQGTQGTQGAKALEGVPVEGVRTRRPRPSKRAIAAVESALEDPAVKGAFQRFIETHDAFEPLGGKYRTENHFRFAVYLRDFRDGWRAFAGIVKGMGLEGDPAVSGVHALLDECERAQEVLGGADCPEGSLDAQSALECAATMHQWIASAIEGAPWEYAAFECAEAVERVIRDLGRHGIAWPDGVAKALGAIADRVESAMGFQFPQDARAGLIERLRGQEGDMWLFEYAELLEAGKKLEALAARTREHLPPTDESGQRVACELDEKWMVGKRRAVSARFVETMRALRATVAAPSSWQVAERVDRNIGAIHQADALAVLDRALPFLTCERADESGVHFDTAIDACGVIADMFAWPLEGEPGALKAKRVGAMREAHEYLDKLPTAEERRALEAGKAQGEGQNKRRDTLRKQTISVGERYQKRFDELRAGPGGLGVDDCYERIAHEETARRRADFEKGLAARNRAIEEGRDRVQIPTAPKPFKPIGAEGVRRQIMRFRKNLREEKGSVNLG